jgi:signal transduction histidine kinase
MEQARSWSGIGSVGALSWGSHFCHFYRSRDDLSDALVPYFKAGLEQNEACLWITSDPFGARDAADLLGSAVPDLPARMAAGQIQILDYPQWYLRTGRTDADAVLSDWAAAAERALGAGYQGLRLTGNTSWLEHESWNDFAEYERRVNESFRSHRIIALCSYCLDRCTPDEVIDVVRNHEFALIRREGTWEQIEAASLRLAKHELHELTLDLERRVTERTAALAAAVRARDEFLSVASHELKTPLASLKMYVDGMVRAAGRGALDPQEAAKRLRKAQEQCERLGELLANLLDFSRAQSGRLPVVREEVDLAALAERIRDRFSHEFARAGRTLSLRVEGGGPAEERAGRFTALLDPTRVEQVLTNLVANAQKHAPGAAVEISVARRGPRVALVVRDDGPGIAAADQGRIFERFEQLPASGGGFGLGLWIVREIVNALGGTIRVASAQGAGASFEVELPVAPADAGPLA